MLQVPTHYDVYFQKQSPITGKLLWIDNNNLQSGGLAVEYGELTNNSKMKLFKTIP